MWVEINWLYCWKFSMLLHALKPWNIFYPFCSFFIKLSIKNSYNYSLNDLKKILIDLSTLDSKIKSGEYDRYVDFEMFLASKY